MWIVSSAWQIQVLFFGTLFFFFKWFWPGVDWTHRCRTCRYEGSIVLSPLKSSRSKSDNPLLGHLSILWGVRTNIPTYQSLWRWFFLFGPGDFCSIWLIRGMKIRKEVPMTGDTEVPCCPGRKDLGVGR